MEQIIVLIVMLLVSTFFGAKGKQQKKGEQRPQPQRRKEPTATKTFDPVRKFKDMSKELLDEIEKEFNNPPEEPPSRQTEPIVEKKVEPKKKKFEPLVERTMASTEPERSSSRKERSAEPHRGRLSTHGGTLGSRSPLEKENLLPSNRQELIRGIIFSEILGPPKSKQ